MAEARTSIKWEALLTERLPAIIDALTERKLMVITRTGPAPVKLDSHDRAELCVVVQGAIRVITAAEPVKLGCGSVLLVAPNALHRWESVGKSARAVWVGASPRHMGIGLAEAIGGGTQTSLGGLDFMDFVPGSRLLAQLLEERRAERKGWLRMCKAVLSSLLILAARSLGAGGRPLPPKKDYSAAENITFAARSYIQMHYAEPLTLTQVAHHVALSPNYLAALFKKQFGRTIIHFLTEVRIEEAKRLLQETDRKTIQIAAEVGYHSPYYFSRAFKRVTHCSPSTFRNNSRA